jgi:hypothetical protein
VSRAFTPRKSATSDERYSLKLSVEDWAKTGRSARWHALVTDLNTGKQYMATGADCGADCFCDAIATPVQEQTETFDADVYFTTVGLGFDLGDNLVEAVEAIKSEAERALILLKLDGMELDDVDFESFWHLLHFSTKDAHLAEQHGFDEVLRAGADDVEPAPWAVKS